MSSVLVQFRTEDKAKAKASSICDRLGLDLQSYLRMCISRMNQENGIPFSMNVNDLPKNRGLEAMKEASRIAEKNGRIVDGKTVINKLRVEHCREDFRKAYYALREEAVDMPPMTLEEINAEIDSVRKRDNK